MHHVLCLNKKSEDLQNSVAQALYRKAANVRLQHSFCFSTAKRPGSAGSGGNAAKEK
jgi:hypothetical protein